MTDQHDETAFFERNTIRKVASACEAVMPGRNVYVTPSLFDAVVMVRHEPGDGISIEHADLLARHLRDGRPLKPDRADWHVTSFGPHHDVLDSTRSDGTSFMLISSLLPSREAMGRSHGYD